jgi:hypothetical protein
LAAQVPGRRLRLFALALDLALNLAALGPRLGHLVSQAQQLDAVALEQQLHPVHQRLHAEAAWSVASMLRSISRSGVSPLKERGEREVSVRSCRGAGVLVLSGGGGASNPGLSPSPCEVGCTGPRGRRISSIILIGFPSGSRYLLYSS